MGPSGTGKIQMALGLGLAASKRELSASFTAETSLVYRLIEVKEERYLLALES